MQILGIGRERKKKKRLKRSGDTRSVLAQYIDNMQYRFHVRAYITKEKLLFKVILHPKIFLEY